MRAGATPSIRAAIDQGGIDVWRFDLDCQQPAAWPAVLTPDEYERGARLVRPGASERFFQARYCLRTLLANYLDRAPAELRFTLNAYGKPSLTDSAGLGFNLSHSGNLGVLAIGRYPAIGVDIEQPQQHRDVRALARQICSSDELAQLALLPDADLSVPFLICWTRKEAYLKALGVGLSRDPRGVTVGLAPAMLHVNDPLTGGSVALRTIEVSATAVLSLGVHTDMDLVAEHGAIYVRQFAAMANSLPGFPAGPADDVALLPDQVPDNAARRA